MSSRRLTLLTSMTPGSGKLRSQQSRQWSGRLSSRRLSAALLLTLHALTVGGAVAIIAAEAGSSDLRPVFLVFLLFVGAAAVVWPGSAGGLVALTGLVVSYVALTTLGAVFDELRRPSAPRMLLLATCLFVAHSVDALRAFAAGAELDRSVGLRWLRRLAEALVPGLLIGAAVMALPTSDGLSPLWLVGAVAVVAAAAVPALRVQRRPWRRAATTGGRAGPDAVAPRP